MITHPRPAPKHALASSAIGDELISPYQKGRGGPGGWWILFEPELHLSPHILVPDLAGWRRERLPRIPEIAYFTLAPDWVCEVLSPSTARVDRGDKMLIYASQGVSFLWLLEPVPVSYTHLDVYKRQIISRLQLGEKLPGGKPKPEVVWREAQDALITLASQWRERAGYLQDAQPGQEQVPPVMIIVADNTQIAELFYRNISGEQTAEIIVEARDDETESAEEEEGTASRKKKPKTRTVYGAGQLFPELFSNRDGFRPTLRLSLIHI